MDLTGHTCQVWGHLCATCCGLAVSKQYSMPFRVDQCCHEVLLPSDTVDEVLSYLGCKASQANLLERGFITIPVQARRACLGTKRGCGVSQQELTSATCNQVANRQKQQQRVQPK